MVITKKKIYILAAIIFIIAAYFSQGFFQFDEHTQVMEFGGYKLGMTEEKNLSWEFASRMRPAIQPAMVYVTHKLMGLFDVESPFFIAFLLRLFTAAISFLSIHLLIRAFYDSIKGEKLKLTFVALSFLLWFSVFNSVRFSSENMAGRLFVIAFALFFIWKNPSGKQFFFIGIILGFSFLFRYQIAFLMMGWLAWLLFINKSKFKHLLLIVLGIVLMFAIGIVIDRWFYGEWVLSTWKYFEENILLGKMAAGWGTEPWYFYIVQTFNVAIPPFSLLCIVPIVLLMIFRWRDVLVWTVVPFLLIHFYIGHKELRFLYPAIGLIALLAVSAGEIINDKWPQFFQNKIVKVFVVLFWIHNGLFTLLVSTKAADTEVSMYHVIYSRFEKPTVVYYIELNPYKRALDVYYYRRPNLSVREIKSVDDIKMLPDTTVLFATVKNEEEVRIKKNNEKVFSAFPNWILAFNVFNWVERTRFWKVYEIKNIPSKP